MTPVRVANREHARLFTLHQHERDGNRSKIYPCASAIHEACRTIHPNTTTDDKRWGGFPNDHVQHKQDHPASKHIVPAYLVHIDSRRFRSVIGVSPEERVRTTRDACRVEAYDAHEASSQVPGPWIEVSVSVIGEQGYREGRDRVEKSQGGGGETGYKGVHPGDK